MIRHTERGYEFSRDDEWFAFKDPHGPASRWQLARLHRQGLLRIADEPGEPVSVLAAAVAIDAAREEAGA